jgi:hypothetical protein
MRIRQCNEELGPTIPISSIQIDIKLDVRSRNITDCLKNHMNTRVSIRNYINSKTYLIQSGIFTLI